MCCTDAAVTTLPDTLFILLAMTVFFPETYRFKLLALMSVRRQVKCGSTLVEVILCYQSKIPSKQPNFAPTCDSCGCGFPVRGLLLVSAYPWQLHPCLSLCLSLCLTLCLCCHFVFLTLPPSLSLSVSLCEWQIDQYPHLFHLSAPPPAPLRDRVRFMFLPAEKTLRCIVVLEISGLKF